MATIKIEFENDGEAVWFWELTKKLGFKQLEVVFGAGANDTACKLDVVSASNTQCEAGREGNFACETKAQGIGPGRNGSKQKDKQLARFIEKNTR